MATRLQQAKAEGRRRLHQEMAVPALYIVQNSDPLAVTVRIHDKIALTGDLSGLAVAHMRDESLHLRFWRDEIQLPQRGAVVSVVAGEAYRLGEAFAPDRETIDVAATRLTAAEAVDLPVPDPA